MNSPAERLAALPANRWFEEKKRLWLGFAAVMLLALILRLIRLGTDAFWFDEVLNLTASEYPLAVWQGDMVSNNPPLFFFLLWFWRLFFSAESEFAMRMLPVLLGLGSIGVMFLFVRHVFGAAPALVTAFLLAVSPLHVYHSQDLKDYIFLYLTGPLAIYCLVLAWERNGVRHWAAYGFAAALAVYSELFSGPLLLAANLWFLLMLPSARDRFWGWFIANAAGALSFLPQLFIMIEKAREMMIDFENWWLPTPTLVHVAFYFKALAFGYSDQKPLFYIAFVAYLLAGLLGGYLAFRLRPRLALLLAMWFVVPVGVVYLISQFTESIFLIRALMSYGAPLYVFVALVITHLQPRSARIGALALLMALATVPLYEHYNNVYPPLEFPHRPFIHPSKEYDKATEYVLDNWRESDRVIHAGSNTWFPFQWYGIPYEENLHAAGSQSFIDLFFGANRPITDREEFDGVYPRHVQTLSQDAERIWFVFSDWSREHLHGDATEVWRWLDAHYPEVERQHFEGIELFLYDRREGGQAVQTVLRDHDDGVSHVLRYTGAMEGDYFKLRPDNALIPQPREARRGNLTLRFVETPAPPLAIEGVPEPESRTITIEVESRAVHPVDARLEALASTALYPMAALYEADPSSDGLHVTATERWIGPPDRYEHHVLQARLPSRTGDKAEAYGVWSLPEGTYRAVFRGLGRPGDLQRGLADVSLTDDASGVDLLADLAEAAAFGEWRWFTGAEITREQGEAGEFEVTYVAENAAGAHSHYSAAYLAFQENNDPRAPVLLPPSGDVRIEPAGEKRWTIEAPRNANRIDIFLYEDGADGQAYHIFRRFDLD